MRWIVLSLVLLVSVPVLGGCSKSSDAQGEAWAMSVCRKVLHQKDYQVLRARRLTADQAKALPGGYIPEDGNLKPPKYMASCKVRTLVSGIPQPPRKMRC